MQLVVDSAGGIRCVYDETIDLSSLGSPRIARASHVEPDAQGLWHADLSPVDGPTLGPFARRSEAVVAERCWLEDHLSYRRPFTQQYPRGWHSRHHGSSLIYCGGRGWCRLQAVRRGRPDDTGLIIASGSRVPTP